MKPMTEAFYLALAEELMTQEHYDAICAEYDIPAPAFDLARYQGDYSWGQYGSKGHIGHRVYQLRCQQRYQERLTAQTEQQKAAQHQKSIEHMRRYEQSIRDEQAHDAGY